MSERGFRAVVPVCCSCAAMLSPNLYRRNNSPGSRACYGNHAMRRLSRTDGPVTGTRVLRKRIVMIA